MHRAKRKSADRELSLKAPHIKTSDAAPAASDSPEVRALRKKLLEMIVRRESQRKAK